MADIVERLNNAHKVMAKLASTGLKSWQMSIPVRDDDTDVVVCGAIREAIALTAAADALAEVSKELFAYDIPNFIADKLEAALKHYQEVRNK